MNESRSSFEQSFALLGRVLMALIFVRSAVAKIVTFSGTAALIAQKGAPYPEYLLVAAIVVELVAGMALALGYKARYAAAALIVFLVPATLMFHSYWSADASSVLNETNHFYKNVAILGALVFVMSVGAGAASLDDRRRY